MHVQNSHLLLLKDLIEIATDPISIIVLHSSLEKKLELHEIAFTVMEMTERFYLCNQTTIFLGMNCTSCHNSKEIIRLRAIECRLNRYRLILEAAPIILESILYDEHEEPRCRSPDPTDT